MDERLSQAQRLLRTILWTLTSNQQHPSTVASIQRFLDGSSSEFKGCPIHGECPHCMASRALGDPRLSVSAGDGNGNG